MIKQEANMMISTRKREPAHYMLKIEPFSLLSEAETSLIIIQSDVFEASGHKWRLDLYLDAHKEDYDGDVEDYISLYLVICDDTESLPNGWEVCVDVNFYLYDHITHYYAAFQGVDGNRIMFNEKKLKWGFEELISIKSFKETKNGYLCNDSCVFGVEVFSVPAYYTQKDRCLSLIKPPPTMNTFTWTIENFSAVSDKLLYSRVFKVGKVNWKLLLYPEGCSSEKGTHLSIYLSVHDSGSFAAGWRFYSRFKLRIKNQYSCDHDEIETDHWFHNESSVIGYPEFMLLSKLSEPANGLLVYDDLIVEVEISLEGTFRNFF